MYKIVIVGIGNLMSDVVLTGFESEPQRISVNS